MRNKGKQIEREMHGQLRFLLRPGGEMDRKVRKPILDLLSTQVILEGALLRVRLPLRDWLTLATRASAAGWPGGLWRTVAADDARQLAAALAKIDLGPKWIQAIQVVRWVAMAGEFKVIGADIDCSTERYKSTQRFYGVH
jgi:hypothetical protein